MSKVKFIYYLIDPATDEIKYIGQTDNLKNRLCAHMGDEKNAAKYAWIESLKAIGMAPRLKVAEVVDISIHHLYINWREKQHILSAAESGNVLFNKVYTKKNDQDAVCEMLFSNNESFQNKLNHG